MATRSARSSASDLGRVLRADDLDLGLQLLDQLAGRADAHVRADERVLDLLPGLLVELAGGDEVEQHRADRRVRPGQPAAQPGQPAGRRRRPLDDDAGHFGDVRRGDDVRSASGGRRPRLGRRERAGPGGGRVVVALERADAARRRPDCQAAATCGASARYGTRPAAPPPTTATTAAMMRSSTMAQPV